jgi:CMP-N-acetylneuraminic acid synthetase
MENKALCIIPARGGSKRFPRKNVALLNGKPLVSYAIETALGSNVFDAVCVSSDDDEILDIARNYGATIARKRPAELATDTAQVRHVCKHLLETLAVEGANYTILAVLIPTNPLRTAADVRTAYEQFVKSDANYLLSLVPFSHPPQRALWTPEGFVEPYFGDQHMKQAQLLDTLYRHDGSIILARTTVFLAEFERNFYGSRVMPYFVPPERSVDIDNPFDLAWAEFLLGHQNDA